MREEVGDTAGKISARVVVAMMVAVVLLAPSLAQEDVPTDVQLRPSFFFKYETPDHSIIRVDLPGVQLFATEIATRIRIPVYDDLQAARLGLEFLLEGKTEELPQALCGQRLAGEDPLDAETYGEFDLCLRLPESFASRALNITLPGEPRYAVRDDGEPLLLFSKRQCEVLLSRLTSAGVQVPLAATTLSGFRAIPPGQRPEASSPGPLKPDCGECAPGETCLVGGEKDCCDVGNAACQSCRSCYDRLSIALDLSLDAAL